MSSVLGWSCKSVKCSFLVCSCGRGGCTNKRFSEIRVALLSVHGESEEY